MAREETAPERDRYREPSTPISEHENPDDGLCDLAEDEAEREEQPQETPCPKLVKTQDQPAERCYAEERRPADDPNPPDRLAGQRQPRAAREAAENAWAEEYSPPRIDRLAAWAVEFVHSLVPTPVTSGTRQGIRFVAEVGVPSRSAASITDTRKTISFRDSHQQPRRNPTPTRKNKTPTSGTSNATAPSYSFV